MKGAGKGAVLAAAVLVLAPLTAGCMATRNAETTKEATTIDGSSANVGNLRLRNIYGPGPATGSVYPVGSDIPIYLAVVSLAAAGSDDQLVSGSSPVGTVTVLPAAAAPSSTPAIPTPTPTPTPTAAASGGPVPIPGGESVDFAPGGPGLLLSATTKQVAAGSFVPVTLNFAQAGSVVVQVAVDNGYPNASPSATSIPTPEVTATATPSPLASAS